MAKLLVKSVVLGIFLYSISTAGVIDGLDYQSESVATSNFVTAGVINPAGLGYFSAMGLRYSHSFTDSTFKGDDALLISSQRGFFGLEWLNHTTDVFRRKYTLAIGDKISRNFYMGISYSWFNGNTLYKKVRSWKLGFLYHPVPMVSMGFIADRINEPKFADVRQKRLYRPGIAVRPFENKITLSSDLRWIEGDDITELNGNLRMEVLPFARFHITADYATEGSWRFGLTFDLEQTKSGGQIRLNNSQDYSGGSIFMELGAINYGSPLKSGRTGYILLNGNIVEEPSGPSLFKSAQRPFYKILMYMKKGAHDPSIQKLLINIDGARLSFASAQEIRNVIKEYHKNNKTVSVYLNSGNNISYYIASAADGIIMSPTGYLDLRGIYATATFYTGTMEKLGIKAQVFSTGPHKTYGDAFTEKGLTDEAREQLNWLMDDLYEQFIDDIAVGRRLTTARTREIIDNGPYTAKDAYSDGLVDRLVYYDDLLEEKDNGFSGLVDLYSHFDKNFYNPRWNEPQKIAIVFANGSIHPGTSGRSFWEGKTAGSSTLSGALKSVRKNNDIKAVVLRVNSPGGDLFATDEIYHQVELLKGKKPLVVSMGRQAASGGYYISMAGDDILASPASLTGSIGVVVGKPDLTGFYEKIGLKKETVRRGKHSDIRSFNREATEDEIAIVEHQIGQYYNDFVGKVSTWRKIDIDSVEAIAGGRTWTGKQALDRGLIDTFGGICDAIELARKRAGIDERDKLILETYPKYKFTLFNPPLTSLVGSDLTDLFEYAGRGDFSLRLPFDLKIE